MTEAIDHIAVGHELARRSGVDLAKCCPSIRKLWEARGLAVIALSRGDLDEAKKIMQPFHRNKRIRTMPAGETQ